MTEDRRFTVPDSSAETLVPLRETEELFAGLVEEIDFQHITLPKFHRPLETADESRWGE